MNEDRESRQDEQFVETTDTTEERSSRPVWVFLLAGLGIISVIIALGIGIFQLAGRTPENLREIGSNLGNLFTREERLVLTTESITVASNEDVSLELDHRNRDSEEGGVYTIRFDCPDEVSVTLLGDSVPCNTDIDLDEIDPLDVRLSSTGERYADVVITSRFISEEKELDSSITLTVLNRLVSSENPEVASKDGGAVKPTEPKTEPKKETTKTPSSTVVTKKEDKKHSNPNAKADLKVIVDGIGYIDEETRDFIYSSRVRSGDRAAVKFTVVNNGDRETGNWYFSASLPVKGERYHKSGKQISLLPGERLDFTLAFDDIDHRSNGRLYFIADSLNQVREISKANNTASVYFDVRR